MKFLFYYYYMGGDFDNAIKHYQNCMKLNPNKTDCLYNLGNAYCVKLDFVHALECF